MERRRLRPVPNQPIHQRPARRRLHRLYTVRHRRLPQPSRAASGIYFQISIAHRLNQFISYSLSAGRSTESSIFGQPYNLYFARLQPDWKLFEKYSLSTPVFWQKGNQLASQLYGSGGSSNYTQYGAGFNIGRALTQKLTASLAYQYVRENSTQSGADLPVNIVSLNLSYQF